MEVLSQLFLSFMNKLRGNSAQFLCGFFPEIIFQLALYCR
jgi:hypothetical protein